jgi:hypothetical protein
MAKYKFLFLIAWLFITFLLIRNTYATEFTEYDRTVWSDMYIFSPMCVWDSFVGNWIYHKWSDFLFISTAFINESRYFIFGKQYFPGPTGPSHLFGYRLTITRVDSSGYVEEWYRSTPYHYACFIGGNLRGEYTFTFGNDYRIFSPDRIFIPVAAQRCGVRNDWYVGLLNFNISKYLAGESGIDIIYRTDSSSPIPYVSYSETDASIVSQRITISSEMYKSYYKDMVANVSFAIGYSNSIFYDFYDLENNIKTPQNIKRINFGQGLSDVKKIYIIPTHGSCFRWNDCLFHVLFEGRSEQNNNRYGIYVREIRYNPTWGVYEFSDRGIIGFNESTGFVNGQMNIIDWYYTCHYPKFCDKIYVRVLEGGPNIYNKTLRVLTFTQPDYFIVRNQVVNFVDNNALVSYATGRYFVYAEYGCNSRNYPNVFVGNINNKTVITGSIITQLMYGSFTGCSMSINFIDKNGTLVNRVSWENNYITGYRVNPLYYVINIRPDYYTIDVGVCCWANGRAQLEFDIDIFDRFGSQLTFFEPSKFVPATFRYTLSPENVEVFAIYPIGGYEAISCGHDKYGYFMYQVPSFTYCSCSNWYFRGCYNSTHEYWTRACIPTRCSDEIRFNLNETCAFVPPTPPTPPTPPQPPSPPPSPPAFNYTAPTGALVLIPLLLGSPLFFAIVFGLALAASIEKKTNSGGITFILTFLGVLIMFSIFSGIVPLWLVLVLIALILGGAAYFTRRRD